MAEYIAKEWALEAVTRNLELYGDEWIAAYNVVAAILAADVAPVVHARWKETDWETWQCTNCGCEWQFLEGLTPEENDANYCPHCGARMGVGENEQ